MPAKPKRHFYQNKTFLWIGGTVLGLVVLVLLAFRVSPWPGALVIRMVFDQNDVKVRHMLEKHSPSAPVSVVADQSYRSSDSDALLDVYYPKTANTSHTRLPTIIWTHGGAWVSGDKANVAPYYKLLAAQGFTVIVINYSLAPEHAYPTAVYQLNDAHAYIQKNAQRFHVDTTKIVLAGDSAGAQLSSQLAALITNPSYAQTLNIIPSLQPAQLRGIVLNCGIYKMHELTVPDPTLPKIVGWGTDVSVWAYAGTRDFSSPIVKQMSPYYHATAQFPPTYITGGNGDPLTGVQSQPFAQKLQSMGVAVTALFYPKAHQPALPHEYQFNLDNSDGQTAFNKTVEFVTAHTQ